MAIKLRLVTEQDVQHLHKMGNESYRYHFTALWHQLIERYIEWSGIGFTHLRPESYMQNILGYQGDNNLNKNMLRSYFGDAILSWIDCTDVAEMAAHCLLSPNQHTGNTY